MSFNLQNGRASKKNRLNLRGEIMENFLKFQWAKMFY